MKNKSISWQLTGLLAAMVLVGCSPTSKLISNKELSGGLWGVKISSPAFFAGEALPVKYTTDGQNISPPLKWSKGPNGVKSWVVVIEDPKVSGSTAALHWGVYNIPGNVYELPEGAAADGKLSQAINYLGKAGYEGPKLKAGETRQYYIEVFALDSLLNLPNGVEPKEVGRVVREQNISVLSKGQIFVTYSPSGTK